MWTKKISYFSNQLTFSKIHGRTSRRIYRLTLLLHTQEMLSSFRNYLFNVHLALFVQRMTPIRSHNSIGKYLHLVKLAWNLTWEVRVLGGFPALRGIAP